MKRIVKESGWLGFHAPNEFHIYISDDMLEEPGKEYILDENQILMQRFNCLWWEYIARRFPTSKPVAVFTAHGGVGEREELIYLDGKKEKITQGWINSKSKDYACIILLSCNPEAITITSKKCLLILPDRSFIPFLTATSSVFSLIDPDPRVGDLDYIIEYELGLLPPLPP